MIDPFPIFRLRDRSRACHFTSCWAFPSAFCLALVSGRRSPLHPIAPRRYPFWALDEAQEEQLARMITPDVVAVLVENHRRFLAFLKPRVATTEEAEEILQAAFVRGIERADSIEHQEKAIPWFYRLLGNALVDHARRQRIEAAALERAPGDLFQPVEAQVERVVCACVTELTATLKPEYEGVLRAVDLSDKTLAEYAEQTGITVNNATVRLHRARQALAKRIVEACGTCCQHGCLDCDCDASPARAALPTKRM